jgi:hypothetical protein
VIKKAPPCPSVVEPRGRRQSKRAAVVVGAVVVGAVGAIQARGRDLRPGDDDDDCIRVRGAAVAPGPCETPSSSSSVGPSRRLRHRRLHPIQPTPLYGRRRCRRCLMCVLSVLVLLLLRGGRCRRRLQRVHLGIFGFRTVFSSLHAKKAADSSKNLEKFFFNKKILLF